jgi:hypothetical protein
MRPGLASSLLCSFLFVVGCATNGGARPEEELAGLDWNMDSVEPVSAPPPGTPEDPRCGRRIPGWRALLGPGRLILVGEHHGSVEIPDFVRRAACEAAVDGFGVHVGVEVPHHEQQTVERFFASEGTPEDVATLLLGGMWNRPYEDGRSSKALLALIQGLHALRRSGLNVTVLYYDVPGHASSEREFALATQVLAARSRAKAEDVFIVLSGNVHARTAMGGPWAETFEPMGLHLIREIPTLIALDADFAAGISWNCTMAQWSKKIVCGARALPRPFYWTPQKAFPRAPDGSAIVPFIRLFKRVTPEGFHGIYYLGELTPSPPAHPLQSD